jgi:hypothetical protein
LLVEIAEILKAKELWCIYHIFMYHIFLGIYSY